MARGRMGVVLGVAAVAVGAGLLVWLARPGRGPAASDGATRTMYVWDVDVVSFMEPSSTSREVERIPIGTALSVAEAGNPGYHRVVSGARKQGFVAARALRSQPPTAEALANAARASLAAGAVRLAREDAERAIALDPKRVDALDVLAAIYDVRAERDEARRVRALREASGAPAPTPTPDAAPEVFPVPEAGETRWVAATKLLVKDSPSIRSKTVAELPINEPVKALEVRGEWVRVGWGPGGARVIEVDLERGTALTISGAAGEGREGWARTRFLSPSELTPAALLAEADALERAGNWAEATRRLERATALAPNVALLERLSRAATNAGLFHIAARTGARFAAAPKGPAASSAAPASQPGRVLDIAITWGCRGDRSRAVWLEEWKYGKDPAEGPADACVSAVPAMPCPPCETNVAFLEEEAGEDAEKLAALLADDKRAFDEQTEDFLDARRQIETRLEALRAAFPDGPFVRIDVPPGQVAQGDSLFVYARPFSAVDACESYVELVGDPRISAAIPGSDAEHRTLWVRAEWDSVLYGVVTARDPAAAVPAIVPEEGAYVHSPDKIGPAPNVFGTIGDGACGCCGC